MASAKDLYFTAAWSHWFILGCAVASILWGIVNVILIRQIDINDAKPIAELFREERTGVRSAINDAEAGPAGEEPNEEDIAAAEHARDELIDINKKIADGANDFLKAEYTYLLLFCAVFAILIGFTVDYHEMSSTDKKKPASDFPYTAVSFLIGALTSILAGWIGMTIATYTNARTTYQCCKGDWLDAMIPDEKPDESYLDMLVKFHNIKNTDHREAPDRKESSAYVQSQVKDLKDGFMAAFQGGQVLGFCLVGVALLFLEIIILTYKSFWFD